MLYSPDRGETRLVDAAVIVDMGVHGIGCIHVLVWEVDAVAENRAAAADKRGGYDVC